jgi:formylmethanofuran dehydrogenase subunit A
MERDLRRYFDQYATVSFDNYPVGELADRPQPL